MILEFRAKKRSKKERSCNKGYNCGNSCIARALKCRRKFSNQASSYAGWLKKQGEKENVKPKTNKNKNSHSVMAEKFKNAIESKNIDELTKLSERLHQDFSEDQMFDTPGDLILKNMFKMVGYDKLPTVLSKANIDKEAAKKGAIETHRGVGAGTQQEGDGYAESFRSGEYFAGKGVFGNGTYMAYKADPTETDFTDAGFDDSKGQSVAQSYAGDNGAIIRTIVPKDYNLASYEEFRKSKAEAKALRKKFKDRLDTMTREGATKEEKRNVYQAMQTWRDMGKIMTAKGFDGFVVHDDYGFLVALNRSKLIVQKENVEKVSF